MSFSISNTLDFCWVLMVFVFLIKMSKYVCVQYRHCAALIICIQNTFIPAININHLYRFLYLTVIKTISNILVYTIRDIQCFTWIESLAKLLAVLKIAYCYVHMYINKHNSMLFLHWLLFLFRIMWDYFDYFWLWVCVRSMVVSYYVLKAADQHHHIVYYTHLPKPHVQLCQNNIDMYQIVIMNIFIFNISFLQPAQDRKSYPHS